MPGRKPAHSPAHSPADSPAHSRGHAGRQGAPRGGLRRLVRRARHEEDGATAIEFGILALPFLFLLGSVVELAAVFFINAGLANAATDTVRGIKTGQIQELSNTPSGQIDTFRRVMCERLPVVSDCERKVTFIVAKASTAGGFNPSTLRYPEPAEDDPTLPDSQLECSGGGETILVRVSLYHDLVLPGTFTRLSNDPSGLNRRVITHTASFRNEPFGSNGGSDCGSGSQSVPT